MTHLLPMTSRLRRSLSLSCFPFYSNDPWRSWTSCEVPVGGMGLGGGKGYTVHVLKENIPKNQKHCRFHGKPRTYLVRRIRRNTNRKRVMVETKPLQSIWACHQFLPQRAINEAQGKVRTTDYDEKAKNMSWWGRRNLMIWSRCSRHSSWSSGKISKYFFCFHVTSTNGKNACFSG